MHGGKKREKKKSTLKTPLVNQRNLDFLLAV